MLARVDSDDEADSGSDGAASNGVSDEGKGGTATSSDEGGDRQRWVPPPPVLSAGEAADPATEMEIGIVSSDHDGKGVLQVPGPPQIFKMSPSNYDK